MCCPGHKECTYGIRKHYLFLLNLNLKAMTKVNFSEGQTFRGFENAKARQMTDNALSIVLRNTKNANLSKFSWLTPLANFTLLIFTSLANLIFIHYRALLGIMFYAYLECQFSL